MKTIGISGSIMVDRDGFVPGYRRAFVGDDYAQAIIAAGAVPFILPITDDEKVIKKMVDTLDGLVLSGGHDVSPQLYNHPPFQKLGETNIQRDRFDMKLVELFRSQNKPILAICRGMQLLNVYHGGTLYQDVSYAKKTVFRHMQSEDQTALTHEIEIVAKSKLAKILNKEQIMVNSFHHQMIDRVGDALRISAYALDGVVEAIEDPKRPFELGVQFHPEMLHRVDQSAQMLFSAFVKAVQ